MKKNPLLSRSIPSLVGLGLITLIVGCTELNNPRYPSTSSDRYDDPYYGGYRRDDGYRRDRDYDWHRDKDRHDHRELDRERDRLEQERRRLEEERQREASRYRPPPPAQDHCPSGFSPSEQKCSPDERRRGCKDIRLPSGLGCVRR